MTNVKNERSGELNTNTGENKCFFCECKEELTSFKSFFICKTCISAANEIAEENI